MSKKGKKFISVIWCGALMRSSRCLLIVYQHSMIHNAFDAKWKP